MDNSFKVIKDGQVYDYRIFEKLDLVDVGNFFSVHYKVESLAQPGRHVTGILSDGRQNLFLKLATTEGTSIVLQNEHNWNEEFNKHENQKYKVPRNITSGKYNGLFYNITEKLEGSLLSTVENFNLNAEFGQLIPDIIGFADFISSLPIQKLGKPDIVTGATPQDWFVNKTKSWLNAIPTQIQAQHGLLKLFAIVESEAPSLLKKPRHGDFTPWHLMKLNDGKLALIDGEHAMSDGVEHYDIAYLVQRIHTICNQPEIAINILEEVKRTGHDIRKLKTVMSARAIGGYLDAALAQKKDYTLENNYKDWVLSL